MVDGVKFEVRFAAIVVLILSTIASPNGRWKEYRLDRFLAYSYFILIVYLMVTLSWSALEPSSIRKAIDVLFLGIVILTLIKSKVAVQYDFVFAFWLAVLLYALVLSFSGYQQNTSLERLSTLGGGSITFARIMAMGILASFFLFYEKLRLLFFGFVVYFSIFISLSGARGVMLAILLPLIFIVISYRRLKTLLIVFVVAGLALMYLPTLPIFENVVAMLERRVIDLTFERGYSSGRSFIFEEAIGIWQARPLFGVGVGAFEYLQFTYAHNIFLELLSETGLVGFCLMLLYLYSIRAVYSMGHSIRDDSVLLTVMFIMISAQFSGSLYDSRLLFMMPLLSFSLYTKHQRHL